jgi:hypothetical protein
MKRTAPGAPPRAPPPADDPRKVVEATAQGEVVGGKAHDPELGQVVISLDVAPVRQYLEQGVTAMSARAARGRARSSCGSAGAVPEWC